MEEVARDCLIDKLPNSFVLQALKNVEPYGEHAHKNPPKKPNCPRLSMALEFCFNSVQKRSERNLLAPPPSFLHRCSDTMTCACARAHARAQMNGSQMTWEGRGAFCGRRGGNKGPNLNCGLQLDSIVWSGPANGWQSEGEPRGGRMQGSGGGRGKRGGGALMRRAY